ncbi:MAG TPA: SRPBCC domain-containing protein [Candidatus Micrarchaeaceae archaeon]|nr:SRPBCC domain-containing protein [Candidatus Micrarchaeaceae archaeon]
MTDNPAAAAIEGTLHSIDGSGVVRMKVSYETDVDDLWSALTDPMRLNRWYGTVEGDLHLGGEYTDFASGSESEGQGRIEVCEPPRRLRLRSLREEVGPEVVVTAELVPAGDHTMLMIEVRGLPLDKLYAYGAGWQVHVEDLAAHLAGQERPDWPTRWGSRWDELAPSYRELTVVPLER